MPSKTVPFSFRISQEDAEYISGIKIEGATTPSEKFRAILSEMRQRETVKNDYQGCLKMVQRIMSDAIENIRKAELGNSMHSELVTRGFEWLPEIIAFLVSSVTAGEEKDSKKMLLDMEHGFADRLFRQFEAVLQLGTIRTCRCYNQDAIHDRLEPILHLSKIIDKINKSETEE